MYVLSESSKAVRAAEIFSVLKTRIVQWEYPPGHRFTEEELCKEFGVSRSPVRETLRMLEENNLVDKIPYRGCTVKQPDLNEINELYDVRVILESAVAEHLATHGMPQADWDQQVRSGAPSRSVHLRRDRQRRAGPARPHRSTRRWPAPPATARSIPCCTTSTSGCTLSV